MGDTSAEASSGACGGQPALVREADRSKRDADRAEWLNRQQALVAIGRRAVSSPSMSVLMQDAAALVAGTLGAECYATAEPADDEATLLFCLNLVSPDETAAETFTEPMSKDGGESLVGYALQMAHPVAVGNLSETRLFRDYFLLRHNVRSALAAPLVTPHQSFGVLVAGSLELDRFSKEDLLFAETVSHLVTTRIDASERLWRSAETERPPRDDAWDAFDGSPSAGPSPESGKRPNRGERRTAARNASGAIPNERRQRPRRSYPYYQFMAPIIGGALPDRSEFRRVRCNDIASGGFSYLASEPPPSDLVMVQLGSPPNLTYVVAQIVHVNRIRMQEKYTYLVGCGYTGRVQY